MTENAENPPSAEAQAISDPCALYHYTSQAGRLGTVESGAAWATANGYLDDTREYQHAQDLLR